MSTADRGRPARIRPHSQPHAGPCRGVLFHGHLLGLRARSAQLADNDGPDA